MRRGGARAAARTPGAVGSDAVADPTRPDPAGPGPASAVLRPDAAVLRRVSHEMRAPLNAMLGFAQILRLDDRHPLDAVQQAHVARIEDAGWQLLRIIEQHLAPPAGAALPTPDAAR
jgi:hypothetical protein